MLRRVALLTVLVAAAGMSAVGVSPAAGATPVTSSTITSPATGFHYMKTDANPAANVLVEGDTNGDTGSVDIRCWIRPGVWADGTVTAAVGPDGHFAAQISTNNFYGTCVLRAVPVGWPATSSVAAFTGPKVTGEEVVTRRVASGPNTGQAFDYIIGRVSAAALNYYHSATAGGLVDSRLQYADGSSSNELWYPSAVLYGNEIGSNRSFLRVDGRNAYGPYSAAFAFTGGADPSWDNPGLPELTYSVHRNSSTDVTTIRETDPIVVCPHKTFPPTPASCPEFNSAGVRLDRTIVTDDGGRQVHITDVWRSTDGKPHSISAHYQHQIEGLDRTTGSPSAVQVGVKLPWVSNSYAAFSNDAVYPGPTAVPATVYVRDNNLAPDGDKDYPRGAVTFDFAPSQVHRRDNEHFTLLDEAIKVPAGGHRLFREAFVVGASQKTVNAKAAANEAGINPWRPDGTIHKKGVASVTGSHVYNLTAAHQTVDTSSRRGSSAVFYVGVLNRGTQTDTFTMKAPGAGAGFGVHYFAGTTDVTTAVEHGTYRLKNLAPGAARTLRLVVSVKGSAAAGAVRSWLVQATSVHDPARRDAVKARVPVQG